MVKWQMIKGPNCQRAKVKANGNGPRARRTGAGLAMIADMACGHSAASDLTQQWWTHSAAGYNVIAAMRSRARYIDSPPASGARCPDRLTRPPYSKLGRRVSIQRNEGNNHDFEHPQRSFDGQ
jgi:hypothetical protein